MNAIPPRIVIYAKDVMNITGCSSRTARRRLEQVRRHFKKPKHNYISVHEFCEFVGLKPENVLPFLT